MKRASLRQVSAKRRALLRERKKLTDAMQSEGRPSCVNCGAPAEDLHELLSRARGGSISDPTNCVPICRPCHTYATEHPIEAEKLGLSKRKGN